MQVLKIARAQIPAFRAKYTQEQEGKCALCESPLRDDGQPALDHCHATGALRGVLCRGCNAMLGHIENNAARNHLTDPQKLQRWAMNLVPYLLKHRVSPRPFLHPTHKTDEDKKAKRAAYARKKRAADKEAP